MGYHIFVDSQSTHLLQLVFSLLLPLLLQESMKPSFSLIMAQRRLLLINYLYNPELVHCRSLQRSFRGRGNSLQSILGFLLGSVWRLEVTSTTHLTMVMHLIIVYGFSTATSSRQLSSAFLFNWNFSSVALIGLPLLQHLKTLALPQRESPNRAAKICHPHRASRTPRSTFLISTSTPRDFLHLGINIDLWTSAKQCSIKPITSSQQQDLKSSKP